MCWQKCFTYQWIEADVDVASLGLEVDVKFHLHMVVVSECKLVQQVILAEFDVVVTYQVEFLM